MVLQMLQRIWNDPVWSKVIAALIIAALSMLWSESRAFIFHNKWIVPFVVLLLFCYWQYIDRRAVRKKLNLRTFETDRETYKKAQNLLMKDGLIERLRQENFFGPFKNDIFTIMNELQIAYDGAPIEYEFIDEEMNQLFLKTMESIQQLHLCLAEYTFGFEMGGKYDHSRIEPEWKHKFPEKYQEVIRRINECRANFCSTYDSFYRKGKTDFGQCF